MPSLPTLVATSTLYMPRRKLSAIWPDAVSGEPGVGGGGEVCWVWAGQKEVWGGVGWREEGVGGGTVQPVLAMGRACVCVGGGGGRGLWG